MLQESAVQAGAKRVLSAKEAAEEAAACKARLKAAKLASREHKAAVKKHKAAVKKATKAGLPLPGDAAMPTVQSAGPAAVAHLLLTAASCSSASAAAPDRPHHWPSARATAEGPGAGTGAGAGASG